MKTGRKVLSTGALTSALAALAIMLSSAVFGADPAMETARVATNGGTEPPRDAVVPNETSKAAAGAEISKHSNPLFSKAAMQGAPTGGVDPHGDSLQSIQNNLQPFAHPEELSKDKDRLKFLFNMPVTLDQDQLDAAVRGKLPKKGVSQISIELA